MNRMTTPPIGLGHDICHIPRIYKILTSQRGSRFIKRVLTPRERLRPRTKSVLHGVFENCGPLDKLKSTPNESVRVSPHEDVTTRDPTFWKAAEYVAGRFAAKEAVIKAFHRERLNFCDIEIESRAPVPRLSDTSRPSEESAASAEEDAALRAEATDTSDDGDVFAQDQVSSGPPVAVVRVEGSPDALVAAVSISHDGDYASAVCFYMPFAEAGSALGAR